MDLTQYDVLDEKVTEGARFRILQQKELKGSSDVRSAEQLFFLTSAGMRLKLVQITLNRGRIRNEPGALYFMRGRLEMVASTGGGIMRGLSRKLLSGESFFVNEIQGTGEVFLEPTFGHFLLVEIDDDEVIVDRSMFYAGSGSLDISAAAQSNLSAAAMGGEGLFQTRIRGSGVAVLFSPVPMSELQIIELRDETLQVDGNFALLRTGEITFSVEKSSKSWLATSVSGEGLLQTFRGTGQVWLAPTQGVYDRLATPGGLASLAGPGQARSTRTTS
ncbi:MAG: AIM24 family protein [Myxococcales bacterium]|nr:AIM24 family protein [Myxococcales bacterium]